ncbi:hypothetical protein F4809DRAFT_616586 [Biscogniauxia mediterranea]|nr:hypothetical protein F4809DRAFT_616586 [Biscogniauxia mediterranea]
MKEAPFLGQSTAQRLTIDGATGDVLGVNPSSSSSEDGVGDVTMASMNPNNQSNESAEPGSSGQVDPPASLMNIDEEVEDYQPEDTEGVEEEYEEDEEEGDVSMMSIDLDLSGFSGSSLDQGSSPMGAGVANASAMDISQSSGGINPNSFETFATTEFYGLPLAKNFKFLISRCLAADKPLRPTLANVLQICESEVANIGNIQALTGQFTSMLMDASAYEPQDEPEEEGEEEEDQEGEEEEGEETDNESSL